MTEKHYPRVGRRHLRHAHRRSRHDRRNVALLTILGVAMLGVLSLGSVLGAGSATGSRPLDVAGRPTGPTSEALATAGDGGATTPTLAQPMGSGVAPVRSASSCSAPRPAAASVPTKASAPASGVASASARAHGPVVFLGDSYTSGYVGAGYGALGWPALVSAAEGWRMTNLAVPGTGFVNPGWTEQPMRTELAAVIRLKPGIIVIAGGHNDRRYGAPAADAAADALIARLRKALPHATLVIVGPIWQDGSPATSVVAIRDHLRAKARAVGALFIDPLAGRWFAGANRRFIGPDGIHPTNAGHRHIAALVLAALRADRRFGKAPASKAVAPAKAAAVAPVIVPKDRRPQMPACPI